MNEYYASMRPPRNAGEYSGLRDMVADDGGRFNEAPAKRGGIRGECSSCGHGEAALQ